MRYLTTPTMIGLLACLVVSLASLFIIHPGGSESDFRKERGFPSPVWVVSDPEQTEFEGIGPDGRLLLGGFGINLVFYYLVVGLPVTIVAWAVKKLVQGIRRRRTDGRLRGPG